MSPVATLIATFTNPAALRQVRCRRADDDCRLIGYYSEEALVESDLRKIVTISIIVIQCRDCIRRNAFLAAPGTSRRRVRGWAIAADASYRISTDCDHVYGFFREPALHSTSKSAICPACSELHARRLSL
jgi:hypothetical protein